MDYKKANKLINKDINITKIIRIKYKKSNNFYPKTNLLFHYIKNINKNIKTKS